MPETEDESSSPDFNEFSKLLLNAQQIANDTGGKYVFIWRGYRACVSANIPKFSHTELERRFKLAMNYINSESEAKTQLVKKVSSSASGPSSSFSSRGSSSSLSSEDPSQIPETQLHAKGNINIYYRYIIFHIKFICFILSYK